MSLNVSQHLPTSLNIKIFDEMIRIPPTKIGLSNPFITNQLSNVSVNFLTIIQVQVPSVTKFN